MSLTHFLLLVVSNEHHKKAYKYDRKASGQKGDPPSVRLKSTLSRTDMRQLYVNSRVPSTSTDVNCASLILLDSAKLRLFVHV